MQNTVKIRLAVPGDAEELCKIYAPYVEKTAVSFEYQVPSAAGFRERIKDTIRKYPYLVAEKNGELCGYACTKAFVGRKAYEHAAEVTIYLREDRKRQGLGKLLYQVLEEISKAQHILNLYACVGYPGEEDEYLTRNSAQFHEHLGYQTVGIFHNCGYKFGRWYHMIWMEKLIGVHQGDPGEFIPLPDLERRVLEEIAGTLSGGGKEVELWR